MSPVSTDTLWKVVVHDTGLIAKEDGLVHTLYFVEAPDPENWLAIVDALSWHLVPIDTKSHAENTNTRSIYAQKVIHYGNRLIIRLILRRRERYWGNEGPAYSISKTRLSLARHVFVI